MTRRAVCIGISILAASAPGWAGDTSYQVTKGNKAVCQAFLDRKNDIEYLVPQVLKADPRWSNYKKQCPNFLKKEQWMPYRDREFDDYALYSVDVDNDGDMDTVLYRRYDKEYFVTDRSSDGREYRKRDGMEITEEFFKVDFVSCKMERVFGAYEKAQLLRLDGVTYIQHLNAHDRAKALTIYKKQKGVDLRGSYLDDMCRFERQ